MLLALGEISSESLGVGTIRISELDRGDASEILADAVAKGTVMGLYDFGAVPNNRRERQFSQLIAAIEQELKVSVPPSSFFSESEIDGHKLPNLWNVAKITSDRPALLVKFFLTLDPPLSKPAGEQTVDDIVRTTVVPESLKFYLVEKEA